MWFWDLHNTRTNGFDINPITYQEIMAWAVLNDIEITPLEVSIIKKLDSIYLEYIRKRNKDGSSASRNKS